MNEFEISARCGIQDAMGRYAIAVDNGRYTDLRGVFSEDATMAIHGKRHLVGISQIIAALEEGAAARGARVTGNFQRHNLTTSIIEMDSESTARATHYVIVVTELGLDHTGLYRDSFRKVSHRWLLQHREAQMEWTRPDSRFAAWLGAARHVVDTGV